jgi:hypothetical protein
MKNAPSTQAAQSKNRMPRPKVPATHRGAGLLAGLLLFAFWTSASAEGPGWIVNVKVKQIVNTANGGVNVRVTPDLTNCVSQSGYGPNFASIYPSSPGISRIKADLLVAYVTGDVVSLYLSDSTCTVTETRLGSN